MRLVSRFFSSAADTFSLWMQSHVVRIDHLGQVRTPTEKQLVGIFVRET